MKNILTTERTKCFCESINKENGVVILPANDEVAVIKDCCMETIDCQAGPHENLTWDSSGAFWLRDTKVFKQVGMEGRDKVLTISNLRLIDWPLPYLIQSPYCDAIAEAVGLDLNGGEGEFHWVGLEVTLWKKALLMTSPTPKSQHSAGMCSPHPNANHRAGICLGGNNMEGSAGVDAAASHILEDNTGYASPYSEWHHYSTTPTTKATLRVVGTDESVEIIPGDGNAAWPLLVSISRCGIASDMWHRSMPLSDPDNLCGVAMMTETHHVPRNACAACPLPCPAKARWVDDPNEPWISDGLKEMLKSRSRMVRAESSMRKEIMREHKDALDVGAFRAARVSVSDVTLDEPIWRWLGNVYPSVFMEAKRLGVERQFRPAAALLAAIIGIDDPRDVFDFHPSYLWANKQHYRGRASKAFEGGRTWSARERRSRGKLPAWAFNMGYPPDFRHPDKEVVMKTLEELGIDDDLFNLVSVYPIDTYTESRDENTYDNIDGPITLWINRILIHFSILPSHIKKGVSVADWDKSISQSYVERFEEKSLGIFTYGVQSSIDPPSDDEDEDEGEDEADY